MQVRLLHASVGTRFTALIAATSAVGLLAMLVCAGWLRSAFHTTQHRLRLIVPARVREERGDVPGWVLITLMTAALVILIWGLAGPALSKLFEQAIDKVGKVG